MEQLKVRTSHLEDLQEIREELNSYCCKSIADIVKQQKLKVSFTVKKLQDEVLLDGKVEGALNLECCRCLENYDAPVNISFVQAYPASAEVIDVEDEIKQSLLLNIPVKPLCKKECTGLCVKCGKNLNLEKCNCSTEFKDPRWEKLKDLKIK